MKAMDDINLRKRRAQHFTATLMRDLMRVLPDDCYDQVFEVLFESLSRNGACWTTDAERERLGFDPRDEAGWTMSERHESFLKLYEAHLKSMSAFIPLGEQPIRRGSG
jgi:hypothetical protein